MGLDHQMEDLTLVREMLKEIVDSFDNIVITERLFESLVLIAQRKVSWNQRNKLPDNNTGPEVLDRKYFRISGDRKNETDVKSTHPSRVFIHCSKTRIDL